MIKEARTDIHRPSSPERMDERAARKAALSIMDERAARKAAEDAEPKAPAPTGRVTVTGVILSVKGYDGYMPGTTTLKMLVKDDQGFKVWSTVPDAIWQAEKGDRVTFTATLTPAENDQYFAKAKRPTKAEILEAE